MSPVGFDSRGAYRSGGSELGRVAAMAGKERERGRGVGGQVGEGEAGVVGGVSSLSSGGTARGGARSEGAARAIGDKEHGAAQWLHCVQQEEETFAKTPWDLLINLQKCPPTEFGNLKVAPEHFYKIHKNSYRIQVTFRCSTKIGEAK